MTELRQSLRWLVLATLILTCAAVGAFLAIRPLIHLRPGDIARPDLTPELRHADQLTEADAEDRFLPGGGTSTAPRDFPVKANQRSGIYHLPGDLAYDRTVASRYYRTAEGADADGFRHALR